MMLTPKHPLGEVFGFPVKIFLPKPLAIAGIFYAHLAIKSPIVQKIKQKTISEYAVLRMEAA